jgi:23S rRNA pseudouridine2605 synthase
MNQFKNKRHLQKTGKRGKSYISKGKKGNTLAVKKSNQYKLKGDIYKSNTDQDTVRLNKYIAGTGLCSRRKADEYIKNGLVTVNGKVTTELGVKIKHSDIVKYDGKTLTEKKKIYILINKPKDCVTTTRDKHAKRNVLELINNSDRERIYPVGRLDRNTTGVLLLTNDGDLTRKLTHPKFNKLKIYHVHLNKTLKASDIDKIARGVTLPDGFIQVDSISYIIPGDKKQVGIEIHSGRNRIIRRIFEHMNYKVTKLDRVYFAGLTKKGLARGKWRYLSEKEVSILKMGSYR